MEAPLISLGWRKHVAWRHPHGSHRSFMCRDCTLSNVAILLVLTGGKWNRVHIVEKLILCFGDEQTSVPFLKNSHFNFREGRKQQRERGRTGNMFCKKKGPLLQRETVSWTALGKRAFTSLWDSDIKRWVAAHTVWPIRCRSLTKKHRSQIKTTPAPSSQLAHRTGSG